MDEVQFISTVVQFVKALGLPTALTLFAAWGAVRIVRWVGDGLTYLGQTVVTPLVSRITKFMDGLDDTLGRHTSTLENVAEKLESIKDRQQEHGKILASIHERNQKP